ncbi:hypothetical protein NW752_011520 [Fusarium irregulare]|uniref:Uncharacterized protein n=1 Tax=Fusarium irregulare TaxID=2494466 RepID=A0A9W8PVN3_9HYPO|nr:hypothetical protein NW752_011520 [Fusarium irregulare]KAJ4019280.1 hypothetical protein NW766_002986 [Fusarium irregulare]
MSDYAERMLRADMALTENGTPFHQYFYEASRLRGNRRQADSPTDVNHLILTRPGPRQQHRLWVMDRIMEPQTIAHFVEFFVNGRLPDGGKTNHTLLTVEEARNMCNPFPDWAPAPFNLQSRSTMDWFVTRIGTSEDSARLWPIAKELHAMKSRIWEGLPPLSERRWVELELDDPKNFKAACQYFIAVINVFAYLNNPRTKHALRTTYNLIWDHLKVFERAVNAKRKVDAEGSPFDEVSVTGLWYQYIRAHYDDMCKKAHQWVIEHIDRIREPIVVAPGSHQPPPSDSVDAKQRELTDKIHDLAINAAEADYIIFMPTDGYKGDSLSAQERKPLPTDRRGGFREEPISWSANIHWRAQDYKARVRFLDRKEMYNHLQREGLYLAEALLNNAERLVITCISQIDGQETARNELRGLSEPSTIDRWIEYARQPGHKLKGFVAYRLCREYDDDKWAKFKRRFEADVADWGRGKEGIDDALRACKIHWVDAEKDIGEDDVEGAKKHFKNAVFDVPVHHRVFLAIDKATIKSYLEPAPSKAKFVLAVDAKFDGTDASPELPGYKGTMRILGSLLWDELGAMLTTQGASIQDLWPFAMSDSERVYRGPKLDMVLKFPTYEETVAWELASAIVPLMIDKAMDARDSQNDS